MHHAYMLQNVYFPNLFTPKCCFFLQKKAPAMNLSVMEVMAMVRWCRCLLVMSPQYPPSGAWALQQALPSTKATRETGWAMTAMNLEPFVFWEGELGRWHPSWRRGTGFPQQKIDKKTRWSLRKIEAETKAIHDVFGGFRLFLSGCNGDEKVVFFEALWSVL